MTTQFMFMLTITWSLSTVVGVGNLDHHADVAVKCKAHHPMKHIQSLTRSHWMPQLSKCLGCIALVTAQVINVDCKHKITNLFASNLRYNQPQKLCEFHTPKWTL